MNPKKGYFYNTLTSTRKDDEELKKCIEDTVTNLMLLNTSTKFPGILLGKIQSGKTRAFLGVISLAFDNGYDISIILTKGTRALSEQTLNRVREDFGIFEEEDHLQIHDIMLFPKNLVPYELNQKLIIVAKKETNNLRHVLEALTTTYPNLKDKRILIIDDEADFASINFHKEKETGLIEQGKIANQIDNIRTEVARSDFLQVTATPYSLYLQPDDSNDGSGLFPPKRPAFTVLLPIHRNYVGGDYYFIESENENSVAAHVYEEVPSEELDTMRANKTLRRADRRSFKIEEVSSSATTKTLRDSIMNFIVGGSIRRLQQKKLEQKQENYSFVIHTEQSRTSHSWQEEVVKKLHEELVRIARENHVLFIELTGKAYQNLKLSIEKAEIVMPTLDEIVSSVSEALIEGMLVVEKVNSDKDVKELLDSRGQLKLRTPLNIFIGGQILDRGITIKNMIGFYYGRNPKRFQQDTVLQHSRMYGTRSREDLAVTRFYTTRNIYETMRRIHEFDNALREAFLNGSHDKGVYFIRKDAGDKLVPCSPNKIMLSNITTLKPFKRLLPVGFQTDYKTNIKNDIEVLDVEINKMRHVNDSNGFIIPLEQALTILDVILKTFVYENDEFKWDMNSAKACLEHLSKNSADQSKKGSVWCLVRTNRNLSRKKLDGSFSNQPDNPETDIPVAKDSAIDIPALLLFRQNGKEEDGWRGSPFWWPVIMAPRNTLVTIFASDTTDAD